MYAGIYSEIKPEDKTMTERNIDLITKTDKKKMAAQQKTAAAANKSKGSNTSPLVRKPTTPKK
jgi:hypothetical protein